MRQEFPEFVLRDEADYTGFTIEGPDGEHAASFTSAGGTNPVFLAFLDSARRIPGCSLWYENQARYVIQGGEILDEGLRADVEELLAVRGVAALPR